MKDLKTTRISVSATRPRYLATPGMTLPSGGLALLSSVLLALTLVPVFLSLNVEMPVAVPLALLTALASQHVFRLVLEPANHDVFFPTTLVAAYFLVYFCLRSFYLGTVLFFPRLGRNPYDDFLPAALWCSALGYIAFSAGISSKTGSNWRKRLPPTSEYWPKSIPTLRLLMMMAVGLACMIYLFKSGMAVGNFGNLEFQRHPPNGIIVLLENLLDLAWVAICIFLIKPLRTRDRGPLWLLLFVSIGTLCAKLAISGGKVALIQPLIAAAIVFHYGRRRFRIWEMAVFGIPVLMLSFGVVNFYRFVVVGQHGSPRSVSDVISRVSSASDLLTSKREAAVQPSALEQMVERNAGIDALALVMKYTPDRFPFVYGVHWLEFPLTFVPRQIWKNKPVNMPSAEFESTYMGLPANYNGFSSMHFISDLYRNFHLVGVVVGMFLFGAASRFVYLFCSPSGENTTGLFLYATLFPEIIHALEADLGYAAINVTRAALLSIVVVFFLGGGFRRLRGGRVALRKAVFPPFQTAAIQASPSRLLVTKSGPPSPPVRTFL